MPAISGSFDEADLRLLPLDIGFRGLGIRV